MTLLRRYILALRLRIDAPFPSQVKAAKVVWISDYLRGAV